MYSPTPAFVYYFRELVRNYHQFITNYSRIVVVVLNFELYSVAADVYSEIISQEHMTATSSSITSYSCALATSLLHSLWIAQVDRY